jgi:hypothetical protein
MPPESGYDHAPVTGDMVMAEPYDALTADGGPVNLGSALGGDRNIAEPTAEALAADAADASLGAAMDGATAQGGGAPGGDSFGEATGDGDSSGAVDSGTDDVDPSAGMG